MKNTNFYITKTKPFNFMAAASSHGWILLAPNQWNPETKKVGRVEQTPEGQVVRLSLSASGPPDRPKIRIRVDHVTDINRNAKKAIKDSVCRMFRCDEDFREFYTHCLQAGGRWAAIAELGWGRLLRSPTLFEDFVKTICTTNIRWGGTKAMVRSLVNSLGEPFPGDPEQKTFPTPSALAAATINELEGARLGYRLSYIQGLARQGADGVLDLTRFEDPQFPSDEMKKQLLKIKGVGPYTAHTLMMLLGRYEHLAYDTVMRDFLSRKYGLGDKPTPADAHRIYAPWGKWKFLAYCYDLWSEG